MVYECGEPWWNNIEMENRSFVHDKIPYGLTRARTRSSTVTGGRADEWALTHPWWWRQYAPLKRPSTIILHGSITQKTVLNWAYFLKISGLFKPHDRNSPSEGSFFWDSVGKSFDFNKTCAGTRDVSASGVSTVRGLPMFLATCQQCLQLMGSNHVTSRRSYLSTKSTVGRKQKSTDLWTGLTKTAFVEGGKIRIVVIFFTDFRLKRHRL
jgi:hypothetical protein